MQRGSLARCGLIVVIRDVQVTNLRIDRELRAIIVDQRMAELETAPELAANLFDLLGVLLALLFGH